MFELIPLTALLLPLAAAAMPRGDEDIESMIIATERAALGRSDKGDVKPFLEMSDENVVYMDPYIDAPIYGLKALTAYYSRFGDSEHNASSKMTNAKVQVAGDVAVLTFRYDTVGERSGKLTRWYATEVYRKTPNGWRIVHTHWSLLEKQTAE